VSFSGGDTLHIDVDRFVTNGKKKNKINKIIGFFGPPERFRAPGLPLASIMSPAGVFVWVVSLAVGLGCHKFRRQAGFFFFFVTFFRGGGGKLGFFIFFLFFFFPRILGYCFFFFASNHICCGFHDTRCIFFVADMI